MSYDNPFAETNSNPYGAPAPPPRTSAQVNTTPSWAVDDGAQSSYNQNTSKDLEMTAESLRRKEAELNRREQDLDNRERVLKEQGKYLEKRPHNWPVWPKQFVRQDINGDIPDEDLRALVRRAYWKWYYLLLCLTWNLVAMCGVLAVAGSAGDFILAIVYLFLWTALAFWGYRMFYNAARKRSTSYFFIWFFFAGFQVLVYIFWGLGLKNSGMAGFLWMIALFQKNSKGTTIVGIFCLIGCVLWWLMAVLTVYLWIHVRVVYKKLGGRRAAEKEFAAEAGARAAQHPDAVMNAGRAVASRA